MVTYNNVLLKSISYQVGVTDEVTECDCCGKSNLKRTVVFRTKDEAGNDDDFVFLGTTCATNAKQFKEVSKSTIKKEKFQVIRITWTRDEKTFAIEWHPLDFNFYHIMPSGEKIFRKPAAVKILISQGNWEGDVKGIIKAVEEMSV